MHATGESNPAVDAVEASAHRFETDAPEADGTFAWDSTTVVLVRVHAAGRTGLGWSYGPSAAAGIVGGLLAPALAGVPALDTAAAALAMTKAVRNAPRPGLVSYAISAVDCALWDLKARLLGVGLGTLLGGARDRIVLYGSGGFTTYTDRQLETQLAGWLERGIAAVKIKIAQDAGTREARDRERIARARSVIGPGTGLFIDANGGYTAKQAIRFWESVREAGVEWFEEPVSSDDLAGLRLVRHAIDADVAAGEYGTHPGYFLAMCTAGAVDCLQVDVSRCGGYTGWLRAAAIAEAHGLEVSAHCAPQQAAYAAAAIPNFRHLEWFHDHVRIESMLFDGVLEPVNGVLLLDGTRPGNGVELRAEEAERHRVR